MESPGLCFRGIDAQHYLLNPGLLRSPYPEDNEALAKLENSLWVEFRLRSMPLLGRKVSNAWEAFLIMQQYGFPTRFLDWSQSLAVGAYFAVRDIESKCDGAVWVMAAKHLMECRGAAGIWRTVVGDPAIEIMSPRENEKELEAFNQQLPVAVSPDQFVPRMIAQQSIYTLHSFQRQALESLAELDKEENSDACFLHKILIPASAKPGIRSELSIVAGVSEDRLFPDLDGFARGFVDEYKLRMK
ncbi:MAG: FRG domain-containing protein [bacterium]|nr:FRG domain-containing protein [bacterium]